MPHVPGGGRARLRSKRTVAQSLRRTPTDKKLSSNEITQTIGT